jgi:PhnB protein
MSVLMNPYLAFVDNARQAMDFYKSVFGGDLNVSNFGEAAGAEKDKVMHAQLKAASGFTLMASDTPSGMERRANGSISLSGPLSDEKELRGYWDKLSAGGQTAMPLAKAPWGDTFGMCVDKFGTAWMVNIAGQ